MPKKNAKKRPPPSAKKKTKKKPKEKLYQLETIANRSGDPSEPPYEGPLLPEGSYFLPGDIKGHVILSVPVTMTQRSTEELVTGLGKLIDKPIIVVTNNVHFMRVRELTAKEAMLVRKKLEEADAAANV